MSHNFINIINTLVAKVHTFGSCFRDITFNPYAEILGVWKNNIATTAHSYKY